MMINLAVDIIALIGSAAQLTNPCHEPHNSDDSFVTFCGFVSKSQFPTDLVQSTVGIEVCMTKRFKEAHMVGVGVDDVNIVGVLWFYHQLGVVAKTLMGGEHTTQKPHYNFHWSNRW